MELSPPRFHPMVCTYDYFASSAPLFMAVANPSSDTVNTARLSALGFVAVITRLLLLFIASVAAEGHQQSAIGLQPPLLSLSQGFGRSSETRPAHSTARKVPVTPARNNRDQPLQRVAGRAQPRIAFIDIPQTRLSLHSILSGAGQNRVDKNIDQGRGHDRIRRRAK